MTSEVPSRIHSQAQRGTLGVGISVQAQQASQVQPGGVQHAQDQTEQAWRIAIIIFIFLFLFVIVSFITTPAPPEPG